MEKSIFERFQANSLGKEEAKSIVGGDYYACFSACMAESDAMCETGPFPPYCFCECGRTEYCETAAQNPGGRCYTY